MRFGGGEEGRVRGVEEFVGVVEGCAVREEKGEMLDIYLGAGVAREI